MERIWGLKEDQNAAKQLGLEGDWSITMMSQDMEILSDLNSLLDNEDYDGMFMTL